MGGRARHIGILGGDRRGIARRGGHVYQCGLYSQAMRRDPDSPTSAARDPSWSRDICSLERASYVVGWSAYGRSSKLESRTVRQGGLLGSVQIVRLERPVLINPIRIGEADRRQLPVQRNSVSCAAEARFLDGRNTAGLGRAGRELCQALPLFCRPQSKTRGSDTERAAAGSDGDQHAAGMKQSRESGTTRSRGEAMMPDAGAGRGRFRVRPWLDLNFGERCRHSCSVLAGTPRWPGKAVTV
ncbi:hypothetical protein BV25DRAFT_362542 [Artomyces pyxidatus]|uniref:Uncharacterized protein n=1 Tax=Artomyces pyxidatus TaxID=48021 RepID=A0ACB8T5I0_9AGAM|nr:hypothetical protein BV25DRAFT_362542 [Artomyces pyxidatus]